MLHRCCETIQDPMNQPQRRTIIVGLIASSLLGLFPPWIVVGQFTEPPYVSITRPIGHAPLFNVPEGLGTAGLVMTYRIDFARLSVYWAVIALFSAAVFMGQNTMVSGTEASYRHFLVALRTKY